MKRTGINRVVLVFAVIVALTLVSTPVFAGSGACTGVEKQFIMKNLTTASISKANGPRHYATYESTAGNGQVDVTWGSSDLGANTNAIGKYCAPAGSTIKLIHTEWTVNSKSIYCDGRPNASVNGIGTYVCNFDANALTAANAGRADIAGVPQ